VRLLGVDHPGPERGLLAGSLLGLFPVLVRLSDRLHLVPENLVFAGGILDDHPVLAGL